MKAALKHHAIFLVVCVGSSMLGACQPRPVDGEIIQDTGRYALTGTELILDISNTAGHVKFTIVNESGDTAFESNQNASTYQRWFFFWDKKPRQLWFYSSDIGDSVYQCTENSKVEKVDETRLIMPEQVFQNLPSSLQNIIENAAPGKPH